VYVCVRACVCIAVHVRGPLHFFDHMSLPVRRLYAQNVPRINRPLQILQYV